MHVHPRLTFADALEFAQEISKQHPADVRDCLLALATAGKNLQAEVTELKKQIEVMQ